MMRNILSVVTSLSLLVLAACGGASNASEAQSEGRPPVAVDVTAVATADLAGSIDVVGTLSPKREAEVKSEYTGTVTEVSVTEWVPVRRGQILARLDSREAEAAATAARAVVKQTEVEANRARREAERTAKLKQVGLATQQQLDDAHTAVEAADAALKAAEAQADLAAARLDKSTILAPLDGVVAYRGVNVGDRVESMGGPALFRIVDPAVLDLVVTVPSTRIAEVEVGQEVEFSTDAFPGRTFAGVVSYLNPTVGSTDRALKVTATVPNADGALRGGMFVKGRIVTGRRDGVLVVPNAALVGWDAGARRADVFVVVDGVASRRTVTTGDAAGGVVEVVSGLAAGDRVVTRGGYNLRDGDRVTVAAPEEV